MKIKVVKKEEEEEECETEWYTRFTNLSNEDELDWCDCVFLS